MQKCLKRVFGWGSCCFFSDRRKIKTVSDSHLFFMAKKGQGGCKWQFTRPFNIASTSSFHCFPHNKDMMSDQEASLLTELMGIKLKTENDDSLDINRLFMDRSKQQLKAMSKTNWLTFANLIIDLTQEETMMF